MSALFHDIRDAVIADVDALLGEAIRVSPMLDGSPDPARAQVEVQAVLRTGEQATQRFSPSRGAAGAVTAANAPFGKATLHVDRATHPTLVVKTGDRVRALDREGQPVFAVEHLDGSTHHRLVAYLMKVS